MELKYILVSDGSSDKALLRIIDFTLRKHLGNNVIINGERAELGKISPSPKTLKDKVTTAIDYYEPDIVFIHRDAEKLSIDDREKEINDAISKSSSQNFKGKYVRIIPVRMMEAWLLGDEKAIRLASGNSNGKVKLDLPNIRKVEQIVDPKDTLKKAITTASELKGRKLEKLKSRLSHAVHLVAEYTEDFANLSSLSAFEKFEKQIKDLKK